VPSLKAGELFFKDKEFGSYCPGPGLLLFSFSMPISYVFPEIVFEGPSLPMMPLFVY
jgi:hypothetical protein